MKALPKCSNSKRRLQYYIHCLQNTDERNQNSLVCTHHLSWTQCIITRTREWSEVKDSEFQFTASLHTTFSQNLVFLVSPKMSHCLWSHDTQAATLIAYLFDSIKGPTSSTSRKPDLFKSNLSKSGLCLRTNSRFIIISSSTSNSVSWVMHCSYDTQGHINSTSLILTVCWYNLLHPCGVITRNSKSYKLVLDGQWLAEA